MAAKAVSYRAAEYLSPRTLCTVVTVLMGLFIAHSVVSLASSFLQLELLNRMASGGQWTQTEAQQNDLREGLIGIVGVAIYLATAIPFLKLLGRLNHNAWWFGAEEMKFTPGWTVGWFFVPFANLIRPVQAVQEIAKISQPGDSDWTRRSNSGLVGLWWGFWLLSNILGQISMRMGALEGLPMIQNATMLQLAVEASNATVGCIALMMVRQLATWQEARLESGERYGETESVCANCGEPTSLALGKCQMCGAELAAAG
jgi:hypothetical protein